jgi:mono/diheme cytochrome c family protein
MKNWIRKYLAWGAMIMAGSLYGASSYVERGSAPLYPGFLDTGFPFVEASVDMRGLAPRGTNENLVPRAVMIPLADDVFVCFDTELLRVAGIWRGHFLLPRGLAMKSYDEPLNKMDKGLSDLAKPMDDVVFSTGLYAGWQRAGEYSFEDPRSMWVDKRELGRGPLDATMGQWLGIEDAGESATLHYRLYGGRVEERFDVLRIDGRLVVRRVIALDGVPDELGLVVTDLGISEDRANRALASADAALLLREGRYVVYQAKGETEIVLDYDLERGSVGVVNAERSPAPQKLRAHWPNSATTGFELGEPQGAYAVDEAVIPYPNPWERRIRPVGIDFFPNGDAVVVTFDGDVYRISGLGGADDEMVWKRIAAGFNEPQSIRIREKDVFIFSRLGVTRLVDRDADGETDFYEMFCNQFTQSAESRDHALSLILRPDGSFVISKGGQQTEAETPHSGRALSISRDGKQVDYFAYGLRNGYLSSHPTEDLVAASDQQGNWVPSTPFHIVRPESYLGYKLGAPFKEQEIQQPALWIPHRVAQSGIMPVWATDPRMGPLEDSIMYIDYQRPGLFRIFAPDTSDLVQVAGMPLSLDFKIPLLKGAMNPRDGRPYFVGFQIWDTLASRLEGLCRLRVVSDTDGDPRSVEVLANGVRLTFAEKLDFERASNPANYQVSSWEYLRTSEYGSAQYQANGEAGVDSWFVHSALVSEDGRSVFLAIDGVRETMQLEVQYNLFETWRPVYFTVNELRNGDLADYGFGPLDFEALFAGEPAPREETATQAIVSVARGMELSTTMGCIGCHSLDGTTEGRSGPSWLGSFKGKRTLLDGSTVKVTEDYLRTSIWDPTAAIAVGYDGAESGMPSYRGILSEEDVESLVLFIVSLGRAPQ